MATRAEWLERIAFQRYERRAGALVEVARTGRDRLFCTAHGLWLRRVGSEDGLRLRL